MFVCLFSLFSSFSFSTLRICSRFFCNCSFKGSKKPGIPGASHNSHGFSSHGTHEMYDVTLRAGEFGSQIFDAIKNETERNWFL